LKDNSEIPKLSTTHTAALLYASIGWHVIPLSGKVPIQRDWPKLATTDTDQIAKWFGAGGPYEKRNIGVVCGPVAKVLIG
jgi:hypothetical protein